jgi:S-formylglutathione hydrolase FrmB
MIEAGEMQPLIVVCPNLDNNTFHTIRDRSARYIGGISSGGYTALSIGLRHQELFSKIGGHMLAIDLSYADEDEGQFYRACEKLFQGLSLVDDQGLEYDNNKNGESLNELK